MALSPMFIGPARLGETGVYDKSKALAEASKSLKNIKKRPLKGKVFAFWLTFV
jgi:hypothetical protein